MKVVVDAGAMPDERALAEAVDQALKSGPGKFTDGTLFVGSGSAHLISPRDPTPHVFMPLLHDRMVDPVVRAQIVTADAVIFMNRGEALRAPPLHESAIVVVLETEGAKGVLRSDTPAEGAGVARLATESPELFERLRAHGAAPPPFDFARVAEIVVEAAVASADGVAE